MRTRLTAVVATLIALAISGCAAQKTMKTMDPEMNSMDTPMDTSMSAEPMMKGLEPDTMAPKMESMGDPKQ